MSKPTLKTSGVAIALAAGLTSALWLTTTSGPASAEVTQTASALAAATEDDSTDNQAGREQMKADLDKARELTGDARKKALDAIHEKAKNGDYGDLPDRGKGPRGHRGGLGGFGGPGGIVADDSPFFALLPDALQEDLKAVKAAEEDKRKDMLDVIKKKALAGGYGDKVKEAWTLMEEHRAERDEKRSESGDDSKDSGNAESSSWTPV